MLALYGHIETFSMMPQWLYRLFDAPIGFGPFSLGCYRAATFVTRMGDFYATLRDVPPFSFVLLLVLAVLNCLDCVLGRLLCLRKNPPWTVEFGRRVDRGSHWSRQPSHFPWGSLVRAVCKGPGLLPRPLLRGVFDLTGLILLSLEFARAKGSKDSTFECVTFCLRRGVVSVAPLFVGLGFVCTPCLCLRLLGFASPMPLWCALPRKDLDLEACLMHSEVKLRVLRPCTFYKYAARSDAFVFDFIGGTSLSSPSLLKYRKKDPIGVLGEVGRAMLRSSELSPVIFRGRRVGPQGFEFKEGNNEGANYVRNFNARAQGIELAWVSEKLALPRKVDQPSGHGSPCRRGRVKVAVGLPAKEVLTHLYGGINLSVINPSVGEVDHGGYARREGCPGRRVACILRRVDEVLVDWRTLSRCEQEAE
ncbi:hypothetical protein CRG98_005138 [Punica granatum]|uniref:Uncharacterized protein n=1 Tax=Punica granatum TaxID=22663 RepID=A0A2I0L2S5_PUNGR|nr:hypothetical protein CRG98_005138 [Punica granatum]